MCPLWCLTCRRLGPVWVAAIVLLLGSCAAIRAGDFAGGRGLPGDPYRIATAEQLISIGSDPNLLNKHYVLIADIDLGRSRVFDRPVIGHEPPDPTLFQGSFDGQGHVIRNLVMHVSSSGGNVGLFRAIANTATVTNLGVVDVEIIAKRGSGAGALAGSCSGTVTRCHSTGRVEGGDATGGLIGSCGGYGQENGPQQCWSSVDVQGSRYVGGLVGRCELEVFSCFATGAVAGSRDVGGLAGEASRVVCCYATGKVSGSAFGLIGATNGTILLSYCTGGQSLVRQPGGVLLSYHQAQSHDAGTGRTEEEMKDPATFRGWSYGGQWVLNAGQDYPRLVWEGTPGVPITDDEDRYGGGTGTAADPYQIWTAQQMATIAWYPVDYDKHFALMADVDMAVVRPEDLLPIGTYRPAFTGDFDGRHHTVANFRYHGVTGQYGGLFGWVGESGGGGTVRNLHLTDVDIAGKVSSGGLAGVNSGVIESCTVTGAVKVGTSWYADAGGLAGHNTGRITGCSAIVQVGGGYYAGGVVGFCNGGQIVQCFSGGSVNGGYMVGGLTGWLADAAGGAVESCYSTSVIQGIERVGGLIGGSSGGLVSTSYFAGEVLSYDIAMPGMSTAYGGLIGKNEGASAFLCYWDVESCGFPIGDAGWARTAAELKKIPTFRGWGGDEAWVLDEGRDYPRLAWEGTDGVPIRDNPARYAGGSGQLSDPYRIETAEQLADIGYHRTDWDKHFLLVNDIDLSALSDSGLAPIGRMNLPFTGSFNGAGHVLRNLRALWEGEDYVGLFGCIQMPDTDGGPAAGRVEHLRVEDANVVGGGYVGIVAGMSAGTIANCDISGAVAGDSYVGTLVGFNRGVVHQSHGSGDANCLEHAGGLVGYNAGVVDQSSSSAVVRAQRWGGGLVGLNGNFGVVVNCRTWGSVRGGEQSQSLGGLVGYSGWDGSVASCYSMASVTAGEQSSQIGGLAGSGDSVTNCFFLPPAQGGGPDNGTGFAMSAAGLADRATFSGWDFAGSREDGTSEIWMMPSEGGPPVLRMLQGPSLVDLPGSGTDDDPYLVASAEQLGTVVYAPDACYRLVQDIDLSGILWTTAVIPVFRGHLDGDGYAIRGLSTATGSCGGLIGLLDTHGAVVNLTVTDASITGTERSRWLGILAGVCKGSITGCQVTGTVMGGDSPGGLVGRIDRGTVSVCCAAVAVIGNGYVGGLVGENRYGTITDCYALGSVRGAYWVGGLVGYYSEGAVKRCYAAVRVTGSSSVGGLVGNNDTNARDITDSYFLCAEDGGGPDNGRGMVLTADDMRQPSSFAGWPFRSPGGEPDEAVWVLSPGAPYPVLATCDSRPSPALPGKGTMADPYRIAAIEHLEVVARNPQAHYRLVADLDLAGIRWLVAPVPVLEGSFDGAGHTIRNLQVFTGLNGGLFGVLGDRAIVTNLQLEDAQVTGPAGAENMGLLAGVNSGVVRNCCTAGSVVGGSSVGGFVGVNRSGVIVQCAGEATVSGTGSAGGLVGLNAGVIVDCYCTGTVRGKEKSGGVVGFNQGILAYAYSCSLVAGDAETGGCVGCNTGTVALCYFLSPADGGGPDNGCGTPLPQDRLLSGDEFVGWDFAPQDSDGVRNVWFMPPNGYPCLAWQTDQSGLAWLPGVSGRSPVDVESELRAAGLVVGETLYDYDTAVPANMVIGLHPACVVPVGTKVSVIVSLGAYDWQTNPGDGTLDKPFVLEQIGHLTALAQNAQLWDRHFVLSQDIDLSGRLFVHSILASNPRMPIYPDQSVAFQGMLDGGGYAIRGLEIVSADDYVGLFGMIGDKGRIQDLSLEDARAIGRVIPRSGAARRCGTGALAGESAGTVLRCGARGVVIGSEEAGGLIGKNKGTVANCSCLGLVMGDRILGGLVGANIGFISNSHATSLVEGMDEVGGLAGTSGWGDGMVYGQSRGIVNCYADGMASVPTSALNAGGLVGLSSADWIARSYFLHPADGGGPDNQLGVALTADQMKSRESFSRWDFYGSDSDGWEDPWFLPAGGPPVLSHEQDLTGLVRVPDVAGLPADEALSLLEQAGFARGQTEQDFHRTIAAGAALGTSSRLYAPKGAALSAIVSLGRYDWTTNSGKGTAKDPYQIATASQLDSLIDRNDLWGSCFVLTSDIDLAGRSYDTALLGRRAGDYYSPTGLPFNGSFDGKGHRIRNLRIMAPASTDYEYHYFGLFAWIGSGGRVANLGLENACVAVRPYSRSGDDTCGALAGRNDGQITACYARVAATGCGDIGGLVGDNRGTIVDCYATGYMEPILCDDCGGGRAGLVWLNDGIITRCYAACRITPAGRGAGLLAESWDSAGVTSCLWDIEASGCQTSRAGLGLTTQKMMSADVLALNGWADSANWVIDDGRDYPRLAWEHTAGAPIGTALVTWLDGQGTAADPYRISRAEQLVRLGETSALWDRHFRLDADLDMADAQFRPLGSESGQPFRGTLDGGGHAISNLTLTGDAVASQYVGLIGCLASTGRVSNLRLQNMAISATSDISLAGLLVGLNEGSVDTCSAGGSLATGSWGGSIGGLVGENEGEVTRCRVEGEVTSGEGSGGIGGLAGTNSGTIEACYAMVSTTGGDHVGGLAGFNAGTIRRSYVAGRVTVADEETWFFGAAVGKNDEEKGRVERCLWDLSKAGCLVSDGGLGLTTAQLMDRETLALNGWAGDPDWVIEDGKDYPRLAWEDSAGAPIVASPIDWLEGSGIAAAPYRIDRVEQLVQLGRASVLWDRSFVLTADLDLDGFSYRPIGAGPDLPFTGVFSGGGHVIRLLTIDGNDSPLRYCGLFGAIGKGGVVDGLGVEEARLKGRGHSGYVGSVAGRNQGTISRCYATGSISGGFDTHSLGGLCGLNAGGTIRSCYAGTAVAAGLSSEGIGGLVGANTGQIRGVYYTGNVTADWNANRLTDREQSSSYCVGGLAGSNRGSVANALWDKQTCNVAGSDGGIGLTTQQMKDVRSYSLNGWSLDPNWVMDDGNDYPHLAWEGAIGAVVPKPTTNWLAGAGTAMDPYRISSVDQMMLIGVSSILWNKHFVLTTDLDFSGVVLPSFGIQGHAAFDGVFDGQGHILRNLRIEQYNAQTVGLFGHVGPAGQIRNLGILDARAAGYDYVAILAGCNEGAISQCCAAGAVQGGYYANHLGGLVARNEKGTISNCYSRADVTGHYDVGGLVGENYFGHIVNCYAAGSVTAYDGGPLVGWDIGGSILSSYHCCILRGDSWASWHNDGSALTEAQAMRQSSYVGWDFADETANGIEDIWWILEGRDYPRLWWERIQDDTAELGEN